MLRLAAVALLVLALVVAFRWFAGGGERAEPAELVEAARDGDTFLDVRRPGEFAQAHVRGARNVDVLAPDFRERVADLPRDRPVYVYCASGARSGRAGRVLEDMGFERVVNAGGVADLERAGVPVVR